MNKNLLRAGMLTLLLSVSINAGAQTLCVFSLVGAQGPLWEMMTDYRLAALEWGHELELRVLTDERVATEDLKAGQCDGALITGIRARQFVPFSGSIDSIGGLHSYDAMEVMVALTAHPQLAPSMRHGAWETAGILPIGAAYLFLNDRTITSVEKIAGRSMAVFDNDRAQIMMAEHIGMRPVLSDVSNFSSKFNNGVVDIIAAPAVAYMPLELYRGVGAHGLIINMPVAQLTMQLIVRSEQFNSDMLQRSRRFFASQFQQVMLEVRRAEEELLFFYPPPDQDRARYEELMNDSRRFLVDADIYDQDMMRWLKKARCKVSPQRAECSTGSEW